MDIREYRYPSGLVVSYERDAHGNLRARDFRHEAPIAGPVGPVSPFVRRALARELPAKVTGPR